MIARALVVAAAAAAGSALAGEPLNSGQGRVDAGGGSTPLLERERLTGSWWGVRDRLESCGLTIGGEYVAEYSAVLDGGVSEQGSFRNVLTIDATLDLDVALGVPGGTLFAQYLSVNAESGGTADAGDLQAFSNIESDRSLDVIYELWYEQLFADDRVRVKVGKVDANSEFNYVDAAGDFANSSAGFSPTIFTFPSYPDPAVGVNVFATLVDSTAFDLTLGYGFYDGALGVDGVRTGRRGPSTFFSDDFSDDYFHVWQVDLAWDALRREGGLLKNGRMSAGAWYHTGSFERFDGGADGGAHGFFVTAEIRFFDPDRGRSERGGPETTAQALGQAGGEPPERGLYVFGQYGWAEEKVSEVAQHVGAGVVWRGPWALRADDSVGVYGTYADLSDEAGAGFDDDEFVVDAYYRVQVTPAVFVQPELQYIVNPSGDSSVDDALVAGVRVGVAF